jgi:serine/threonine-protein kinase
MSDRARTDQNLLFGILALQMDFISRDALVVAMNAWVMEKETSLEQILLRQGALQADTHTLLEALVQKHLRMHGGDAQKSLAAVSSLGSARQQLQQIADPDLHVSLAHVAVDPDATRAPSSSESVVSGPRFRILRPYAKGGLGEVFVARDTELHREVALKEIQNHHADDPQSRARFVLEAEITGGLEHPGIVPVYGLGQYADGRPYYAMRFIKGDSLHDAIQRFHKAEKPGRADGERVLALRQLLGRFVDVCDAVAYAHSRGVLHRDLKPRNIMLGPYGETLVVDWGLAKSQGERSLPESGAEPPLQPIAADSAAPTLMGSAIGTPGYMPPEQAAGRLDLLGAASDVYSLGATLYCLLVGKAPFAEPEKADVLQKVQRGEFPRPREIKRDVPAALEAICLKAMSLRPEDRYSSPRLLAADIERWLADEPVSAWREPWPVRARRRLARHRTLAAAVASTLLVGTCILAVATVLLQKARRQAEEHAQSAESERGRAEHNLEAHRQAVRDYNKLLTEGELAREPGTQPLRQKLLQSSLETYEDFLRQRPQDYGLRTEVAETRLHLCAVTSEAGSKELALREYQRLRALFDDLLAEQPQDLRVRTDLAKCWNNIGLMAYDVGRTSEARQAFQRVQELLALFAREAPEAQHLMAGSYNNLGRMFAAYGRPDDALAEYQKAIAAREELVHASPDEPKYQQDLVICYSNLAVLHNSRFRPNQALDSLAKAQTVCEKLVKRYPNAPAYQETLAAVHNNRGAVYSRKQDYPAAQRSCEEGLALRERLVRENPGVSFFRARLASSCANQGIFFGKLKERAKERESYLRAADLMEKLLQEHPGIPEYEHQLCGIYLDLGDYESDQKHPAEARRWYRQALETQERLTRLHPDQAEFQYRLVSLYTNLGNLERDSGAPAEALKLLRSAAAALDDLAGRDADNHLYRSELGRMEQRTVLVLEKLGSPTEELVAALRRAVQQQRQALERAPENKNYREYLTGHLVVLSQYLRSQQKWSESEAPLREVLMLWPGDAEMTIGVAVTYASYIPLIAKSASPKEREAAEKKYGDLAMATLRQAIAYGYKNKMALFLAADLNPIRKRPDFQELLKSLK